MNPKQHPFFSSKPLLFLYFLLPLLLPFSHANNQSLDSIIKQTAFNQINLHTIGTQYKLHFPANLTGVEASAMKTRSNTFLQKGLNFSSFHFPPGIVSIPNKRRLLLVIYTLDLNLSRSLYSGGATTAGYSLDSPVTGFVLYDAWDASNGDLGIEETGGVIKIAFPESRLQNRVCARFGETGEWSLEGEEMNGTCTVKRPGRFGVVVRVQFPASGGRGERDWRVWVGVGVGSLVIVMVLGVFVGVMVRRRKRMREMVKEGEEGEALEVVWVGWSKMPSAGLMRTQPIMEK